MIDDPRIYQAEQAIQLEKYDHALGLIKGLMASFPEEGELHFLVGICLHQKGRYIEAEHELCRAIGLNEDSMYYALLSDVLYVRSRYDEAIAASYKALQLDPISDRALESAARAHLANKEPKLAQLFVEQAVAQNSESKEAKILYAHVLMATGDTDQAVDLFTTALAADPHDSSAHIGMAVHLLEKGNKKQAAEHAGVAIKEDPTEPVFRTIYHHTLMAKHPLMGILWWPLSFLWRLTTRTALIFLGLCWVVMIAISHFSKMYPAYANIADIVLWLYLILCVWTWIGESVVIGMIRKGWIR